MPLSERERAILRQLMRGTANRQIARDLDITEAAVKMHLTGIIHRGRRA
jgi:DNA-binding NarL/FixJ family response regulator